MRNGRRVKKIAVPFMRRGGKFLRGTLDSFGCWSLRLLKLPSFDGGLGDV